MGPFFLLIDDKLNPLYTVKMNPRVYLDYNATAPLSKSVIEFLKSDHLPYGNPSSTHSTGKLAKSYLVRAKDKINEIFNAPKEFGLFFHSGATEGINTFFNLDPSITMAYFSSDHSVLHSCAKRHAQRGGKILELPITETGDFDFEVVYQQLVAYQDNTIVLNYTYANNETGIVWDLEKAKRLKDLIPKLKIHVDAAQIVGKIDDWNILNFDLDAYTFSGHKFGAMKGTGFSFYHQNFKIHPLVVGGSQQKSMRAGTENVVGVYSISLALSDSLQFQNGQQLKAQRQVLESQIKTILTDKIVILAENMNRLNNTIAFIHKNIKGDMAQIKFDLNGIDVSYGSACSSGSLNGSHVVEAMKLTDFSKNLIRLSFGTKLLNEYELSLITKTLKEF